MREKRSNCLNLLILEDVAADADLIQYELRKAKLNFNAACVLTEEEFRRSLSAFDEQHALHARDGIVHPGCLMRLAMGDTHNSFRFPSAIVLTALEAQHFACVRPGQGLTTVGRIADAWVRNGKHYFQSEEFLRADGRLAARFLRTQIYGYENV